MKRIVLLNDLKKIILVATTFSLIFNYFAPITNAITQKDLDAIRHGTPFFSEDDPCKTGVPGGNGPLLGPAFPKVSDTALLAQRISDYIKSVKPNSGLVNNGEDFVKYGQQYNVNPVLLVAVGQRETQFGTDGGIGNPPKHNFWGNRSGSGWASYPDYAAAIEGYFNNLRTNSAYAKVWAKGDAATVDDIIYIASPPSENATAAYVEFVHSLMDKILGGLDGGGSSAEPAAQASSDCGNANTAGTYGWELTGANAMVSYDQTDPKWSNHPYGADKSSIGESGCGPTSLAMIAATLLGDNSITPVTIADRYGAQYHQDGTVWSLMPVFARDYGLKYQDLGTNLQAAADVLKGGGLVLISVDPGYFTSQGHFMVLRAVTPDGTAFYINDPNGKGRHGDSETRSFTTDFLVNEGSMLHLWGYSK
jgi:hypothetical protein